MAKTTDGGYTRPAGFKPRDGEGSGLDGFFKSEAWAVWQKAEQVATAVQQLLSTKSRSISPDKLKTYDTRFSDLNRNFNARWADVKSYSEGYTRWGKYIDEGLAFHTQWAMMRDEINADVAAGDAETAAAAAREKKQEQAAADTSASTKRKTRKKTDAALARNGGDPEAAADTLASTGNVASTPGKPLDPLMIALWVAGGLLVAATVWSFWPTKTGAVAGLHRRRK